MEIITGRLTKNAEIKKTKDHRELVSFTIVINDTYKTKSGEKKKEARFFNCAYWVSTAIAAHLKKGMLVTLTGRVGLNAYTNKEGDFIATLTFHADNIKILAAAKEAAELEPVAAGTSKDDLPF